jgi:hypothetical protein
MNQGPKRKQTAFLVARKPVIFEKSARPAITAIWLGKLAAGRCRVAYGRQPKATDSVGCKPRLLYLVDVDSRVVTRGKRKGQSCNNDLHCVTGVGRERHLIV